MDGENIDSLKGKCVSYFELGNGKRVKYYSLPKLEEAGIGNISTLPFSIRIVLESLLRNADGMEITYESVKRLANWDSTDPGDDDIPFKVSRILMQDFTGVPAVVDLAMVRDYLSGVKGIDAGRIQPQIPIDLIIDHSVQVDAFDVPNALQLNQEIEMRRNKERYQLLKWASKAFASFKVFPPSAGICHQVNLEYLATCITTKEVAGELVAYPDTLVGTDSHTTMINGLGVVGFGVGGIEAEAALLGLPVSFTTPKVLGVKLTGALNDGVTATDFALTLTKKLREKGVVNMFVEFFGSGLNSLTLPDRATLSNMCPEYGATIAIFPVDEETLRYLESTGRSTEITETIRKYYTAQGMLGMDYNKVRYSDILEVDLGSIVPSVSGPSQPKEQMPLGEIRDGFIRDFVDPDDGLVEVEKPSKDDSSRLSGESGNAVELPHMASELKHPKLKSVRIKYDDGYETTLSDGDVVISAITSCTNTSNPSVMIAAGLLAKKALEKGLRVDKRKVKTSLAPGSRVVTRYLEKAGLLEPLEKLGYDIVGYGCTTCIGNSGPLIDKQSEAINANKLAVAAVLSGNRNYQARIHRDVAANYLMSPPLLVAFGIAGTVLKDLTKEPLAKNANGEDVYLKDIWPSQKEISDAVHNAISEDMFEKEYGSNIYDVNQYWNALESASGDLYAWDESSTYIRLPPFLAEYDTDAKHEIAKIKNAAILAVFGDSISTDHISPAGAIGYDSPAGKYLVEHGITKDGFNTYGSRRGNHEVMMRGTFANNRIRNLILDGVEGGYTLHYPTGEKLTIYDAAMKYMNEGRPAVVFGGVEYGSGSSRDWAAKGPMLLGVKAVIAKSFERIHRSNLIGMGIIPLEFMDGQSFDTLKIDKAKPIDINLYEGMEPRAQITMHYISAEDGKPHEAVLKSRIDTPIELAYFKEGGILNYVAKKIASADVSIQA